MGAVVCRCSMLFAPPLARGHLLTGLSSNQHRRETRSLLKTPIFVGGVAGDVASKEDAGV